MRRPLTLGLSLFLLAGLPVAKAYAQGQDQDDQRRQAEADQDAKKKKKDKEWKIDQAPLPETNASGPCPFAKALYDASRYVELKDGEENPSAVSYTGEIEHVIATCAYKGVEPIKVHLGVGFEFGKGPLAKSDHKEYRYWVAVTVRNLAILDKQYFTVAADFPKGTDRVAYADHLADIVIPRAKQSVSGSNFEILVGFDVTPQMAEFNRLGKRFRANATGEPDPAPTPAPATGKTASNSGNSDAK